MAIIDAELQKISLEKQNTIKQLEAKEITEEQFKMKICELETLEKKRQADIMAPKEEPTPETQIVNTQEPKKKRGRPKGYKTQKKNPIKTKQPRKREYMLTEYIVKALEMKGVKNIEQAISKIQEWLPDKNLKRENLGPQIRVFISAVSHKKIKKYKDYTWDDENYLLTKKE